MGIRKADKLREELSIPDEEEVVSVISLGYRDIEPQMPKRKDLSEIAKFFWLVYLYVYLTVTVWQSFFAFKMLKFYKIFQKNFPQCNYCIDNIKKYPYNYWCPQKNIKNKIKNILHEDKQ